MIHIPIKDRWSCVGLQRQINRDREIYNSKSIWILFAANVEYWGRIWIVFAVCTCEFTTRQPMTNCYLLRSLTANTHTHTHNTAAIGQIYKLLRPDSIRWMMDIWISRSNSSRIRNTLDSASSLCVLMIECETKMQSSTVTITICHITKDGRSLSLHMLFCQVDVIILVIVVLL